MRKLLSTVNYDNIPYKESTKAFLFPHVSPLRLLVGGVF
jgi:hypothetical protein